ncbi:MAG TPA: TonB-dependent receptor [Methylomirabilota bacterium]|nr:TonB-dependent receptor [Methylomirabilota bacterium]
MARPALAAEDVIQRSQPGLMIVKDGSVNFQLLNKEEVPANEPQPLGFGDSLRTLRFSGATVQFNDRTLARVPALTRLSIIARGAQTNLPAVRLYKGEIYVSHRGGPVAIAVETPQGTKGTPKGTEFSVLVDEDANQTVFTMFDGEVTLENGTDTRRIISGFQGIAKPGQKIEVRPILEAKNIVQWWIYYPAVLDAGELAFTVGDRQQLAESLNAYRAGDLRRALEQFPGYPDAAPGTEAQRLYYAALLLSGGDVAAVDEILRESALEQPAARALRWMIDAVAPPLTTNEIQRQAAASALDVGQSDALTSSEWLALSYAHQATNNLAAALSAAQAATKRSPEFGFGWARVAELEFSFGHTRRARAAIHTAIKLSPRHAQAHALRGFLLAAENRTEDALKAFNEAIALDRMLGNAWLGRGLVRIRRGDVRNGREDIETASGLEPRRSLLRSYTGKAYADAGLHRLAEQELHYAAKLDANDPTPPLYSSLLHWEQNRINEALRDLERSMELNDNRALFRSQLLLDQDRAVRGANLARIYADAGMTEVSVREAVRAVNADYANYSAHLFLANSYNELRDPRQVNLRYETPWFTEYLVANLLAPVSAGTLSQSVSQQEYSKLFARDRFGFVSSTEYLSRGDWIQSAVQYGVQGNFGYALEQTYRNESLDRANGDSEQRVFSLQLKYQLTPDTSVYVQAIDSKSTAGDLNSYYNNLSRFPDLRLSERQEPLVVGGLHHQWSPEHHTLLLAGRLEDRLRLNNPDQPVLMLFDDGAGRINAIAQPALPTASLLYESDLEMYPLELQHLWRHQDHQITLGVRYQFGTFDTTSLLGRSTPAYPGTNTSVQVTTGRVNQDIHSDFNRFSAYAYEQWQIHPTLLLIGGVSYDRMKYPGNFRAPPLNHEQETTDQISPKAGFIWDVTSKTVVRGAYTRSLGGVSLDQSVRLEPSQVAGFNQAYRSLIPEAVAGATAAPRIESWGIALDQKFGRGTYLGLQGEWLRSDVDRDLGIIIPQFGPQIVTTTGEKLRYDERALQVTINQLLGNSWSVGAQYRFSRASLEDHFVAIPVSVWPYARQDLEANLHQVRLFARCNFRNGIFAQADSIFLSQENDGYRPELPGDDVWQFNAHIGYRFPRRRAELRLGVLNLTNQDYRLNPLNVMNELPRERTFTASVKIVF